MDVTNNERLNIEAVGGSMTYNKAAPQIIENSPTGRFSRFDEEIGSGAYKTVYKAIDNDTGCEVAWNTVKTHGMTKAEKERVRDEIMIIQKLKHPNILHFIKAWHNKNREEVVFITEIMTGGSLKQYLKKIKTPRLKVVKKWCKFILEGLNYLHSQKPFPIIHRDLKCDNIFVSARTGEIRIGDLGLSTFMRSSYNKSVVGTPQYMAPELFEERYGTNVDIYSFGLCILEMCTGEMPYSECKNPMEIYQRVSRRIKPLALEKIGNLDVKEFITLCLTDMDQRPSAEELLNHPFFNNDENDDKNHDIINILEIPDEQNSNFEEKTPKVDEFQQNSKVNGFYTSKDIQLSIKIGVLDKSTGRVVRTKLDFLYNLESDTPEGVAEEIVSNFALESNYTESIAMIIHKKLSKY
ncbi:unnamed protein product [Blepharisma stoltei]|uniref:Protein kinase domain-containing protein n=1 Tax=Blepharisma stoltei TaxID=1481888 RepID=A0AAU9J926_9CILI|nr:unnamed protein product [Blepharisma stoltei]